MKNKLVKVITQLVCELEGGFHSFLVSNLVCEFVSPNGVDLPYCHFENVWELYRYNDSIS